jgi:hypothetical protein
MVSAALACHGIVLIAWQHQDIPWENADGDPAYIPHPSGTNISNYSAPASRHEERG